MPPSVEATTETQSEAQTETTTAAATPDAPGGDAATAPAAEATAEAAARGVQLRHQSGREEVVAPVYDHQSYDIVPGARQVVDRPDILVLEGLNVLQAAGRSDGTAPVCQPSPTQSLTTRTTRRPVVV